MFTPAIPRPALPSPFSPHHSRRDSVTSEQASKPADINRLQIRNLLNPMTSNKYTDVPTSLASTPAYRPNGFTPNSTPAPDTPSTPASAKRPGRGKGKAVTKRAQIKGVVHYKSYECNSDLVCTNSALRGEIIEQHRNFKIAFEGDGPTIGTNPHYIPYASSKKDFFNKTGREGFEFFEYTFIVPNDPEQTVHSVRWDYQIGLVRVTAFFKAFDFAKTTPAKAITASDGLHDLCHSITGGSLDAQGYWVPFECARAICLTFCWNIRWALTPVFGPEFVTECLPPDHPCFRRWKIDADIIARAKRQAEQWRSQVSRSATPVSQAGSAYGAPYIPMYQPPTSAPTPVPAQALRPQRQKHIFKEGSPFSQGVGSNHRSGTRNLDTDDSDISPKSSPARTLASAWTSINQRPTPPVVPRNTPVGAVNRPLGLLTQPYNSVSTHENFWRDHNGERSASPASAPAPKCIAGIKRKIRRRSVSKKDESDHELVVGSDSSYKSSPASSDSEVVSSPPPSPAKNARLAKRARRLPLVQDDTVADDDEAEINARREEEAEVDPDVIEAAKILLAMAEDDKKLHRQW